MLELDANSLLGAATNLARIHQIISGMSEHHGEPLAPSNAKMVLQPVEAFREEASQLGARLAVVSADRLIEKLNVDPCPVTVAGTSLTLSDIESRFADFLTEIRLFALSNQEAIYLGTADELIEMDGFSSAYPKSAFEIEEAAKCIALGRYTASVFHAMRMLELGIKALSKRLDVPDPTTAAGKNWGLILKSLRATLDDKWPPKNRLSGTEGAEFEGLLAHLDAVRNPWRNATMHVETIYAPHEALHIIRCSAFFMRKLAELSDEDGTAAS